MRHLGTALLALVLLCAPSARAETAAPAGADIFKSRCARCHGERGDGDSEIARVVRPAPSNLLVSTLSTAEKVRIVTAGGAAVGRSAVMPEWGKDLSGAEIRAVVAFIENRRIVAAHRRP